jgi:penicillin-binding protein 1A
MNDFKRGAGNRRRPSGARKGSNTFTTKSGKTIKLNRNLGDRIQARREAFAKRRAERLAGLPKSRIKRAIFLMHPKRMYKYWFSREGGIMALKVTGIGIIAGFLLLVGVFAYFRKDLPNLKDISGNNIGGSVLYYDKSGKTLLWEDVNGVKRIPVQDSEISQYMKDATVAVEDKDFFKHGGFDVRGIARAGFNNAFGNGGTQGGSTITQQLVKLTNDWTKDRTYKRKVKELILSVELERSYTKKEILTGYLNAAPYGGVEYGVEAAARNYFQKSAKDITLDEAAMLAAIPKSPSVLSPYANEDFRKDLFIGRQHYILDLMEQQGLITSKQRDEAKKVDTLAKVKPRQTYYAGIKSPYFVLLAKKELETKFGDNKTVKRGGYKVITTLDTNLQNLAEEQVNKGMTTVRRYGFDTAAFVAEDVKTGQVVAVVGGADFTNKEYGENNYAHWRLPPGSSFKPYDYLALIEHTNTFGAGSVLYDTQGAVDGYPCTNKAPSRSGGNCLTDYDFRYPGPMTLRYALGGSRNVPAVKAMLLAGIDKTIGTAQKLGLEDGYKCYQPGVEDVNYAKADEETQCYSSSAIGDGAYLYLDQHVNAYTTISRNGVKLKQTYILNIEDANNKSVYQWKPEKGEQVVRPDAAYIVADMLSDPNASYFPAGLKPHRFNGNQGQWKFAMKTGTTNDSKDGWMMGFSTQYAAGVWVGHHTRRVAATTTAETMTLPIWRGWMQGAHRDLKPEERPRPSGVKTATAFVVRSHVGIGSVEPSPATDLYPSWYTGNAKTGKKTIDIVSNKLATDCTPDRAKKELSEADASSLSGDRFANQNGSAADEKDDVHLCSDVKPAIRLIIDTTNHTLQADVTAGTHPLSSEQYPGTVNFLIDGQIISGGSLTVTSSGLTPKVSYDPSFDGTKTVTAQVIDSVLYDASDSGSISGTGSGGGGPGNPLTITSPTENQDVGGTGTINYTITWTGGSPNYVLKLNGVTQPCNQSQTSCIVTLVGANNTAYTVVVTDSSGTSSTVHFKK